ncbi:MAG: response regulator [Verrucomicrobia bacterium]|nr:response regulator [Verrucomicrobiota bacterium]
MSVSATAPHPLTSRFGPVEPHGAPPPTLMVVDDEDGPRHALEIVFKPTYQVLLARDGAQALELAEAHAVDAVILDIRMPGMSGIEVLRHLKEIDPSIEVIMLTAYETLETARQALRLGARDYLTKPFEIATIRLAVSTAMDCKRISRKIQLHEQSLKLLQEEVQNQTLQERIARTRSEIYASILHDINGPLTVISAFVEMLNQNIGDTSRVEGEDLDRLREQLYRVAIQVDSCVKISRRYLSFLRNTPETNHQVSVNQTLKDVRQLLHSRPDCRPQGLSIQFLEPDLKLRINGTDLVQLLLNLAVNAFQCSGPSASVEIAAHLLPTPPDQGSSARQPGRRRISAENFQSHGPLLELTVRDSGSGIPGEIIDRIFDPYFSTKPQGQGTGLGLSIVHRLVMQSAGCIDVTTDPGRGTEFKIYLPATIDKS